MKINQSSQATKQINNWNKKASWARQFCESQALKAFAVGAFVDLDLFVAFDEVEEITFGELVPFAVLDTVEAVVISLASIIAVLCIFYTQ